MHQALGLVGLIVDGELHNDQIGLHRTVTGDIAIIADDAQLAGSTADASLDVADMGTVVGGVLFADGLVGLVRVAQLLRGDCARTLGDGAAQERDRRGLALTQLLQNALDANIVAGAQAAAGNRLIVGGRIEGYGRVGVDLGDRVAVVQVELDGGRGDVLRLDELEQELLRRLVAVGPLLRVHHHDMLGAVGGDLHAAAAAATAQLPGEAEGERHNLVGQIADDADADAVHELAEVLGRAEHFQNGFVINAADHLGESHKAVAVDVNGVSAHAVIARQAAHRFVQQHIKSRTLGRRVFGCDLVQHRLLHSFLHCLCFVLVGPIRGPNISSAIIIPHSENTRFSFFAMFLINICAFYGLAENFLCNMLERKTRFLCDLKGEL